ncbi:MAG TPA: EutN/CcmL family microcompartment protein, partial [Thiobacillaceae bacterium]|nr:EutN/CcmL family microcompartment protein [Thiobacillaceae bacterium]
MQVEKTLVSTNRIAELGHRPLLVVREKVGGGRQVAVDAIGCIPGDWVICV